jgi:heme/copper-type cytochrome/quinol oxidase subunit 2
MDKRTKICIWVILVGLANFLSYWVIYLALGAAEAINGMVYKLPNGAVQYMLHSGEHDLPVSRGMFIYSGIHSLTIWVTVAAMMLAMLTLAKERIVSSMRSTVLRGRTLITILATIITLITIMMTIIFALQFAFRVTHPQPQAFPPCSVVPGPTSQATTRP